MCCVLLPRLARDGDTRYTSSKWRSSPGPATTSEEEKRVFEEKERRFLLQQRTLPSRQEARADAPNTEGQLPLQRLRGISSVFRRRLLPRKMLLWPVRHISDIRPTPAVHSGKKTQLEVSTAGNIAPLHSSRDAFCLRFVIALYTTEGRAGCAILLLCEVLKFSFLTDKGFTFVKSPQIGWTHFDGVRPLLRGEVIVLRRKTQRRKTEEAKLRSIGTIALPF